MTVRVRLPLALLSASALLGACSSGHACTGQVSKVRTDPYITLPGVGAQAAHHWAGRQQGDTCARAPGPTDWHYQDVVALSRTDVATLTHGWTWHDAADPSDGTDLGRPADAWPQLSAYLPAGATWVHSDDYDQAIPPLSRWNVAFLDTADNVLLVFSFDH